MKLRFRGRARNRTRIPRRLNSSIMEGLMGAAKDAMGGGEAPPHDPAEAEVRVRVDSIIPDDSRPDD